MSKMEISNNMILCMFIMFQSIIVIIALLLGISVFTSRYDKYKAVHDLIGDEGVVLNAQHFMWAGSNPDNMICCEKKEIEELFPNTKIFSTYNVWATYDYEDIWDNYEPKTIAYDNEVAATFVPDMDDGRWLKESDNKSSVVEAVITNNKAGIEVGDEIYITTDFFGEQLEEKITIKIVGVVSDNTYIIGAPASYVEEYDDVRDCFFMYSIDFDVRPYLFFLKEDLRNAENELLGSPHITTAISGIQFINFDNDIKSSEIDYIESVISSEKCNLDKKMNMDQVMKNSKKYIWNQLDEVLPIFIGLLVLIIMSVICSSAMMTRSQLKNYAIYYTVGLKWSDCIKIQILQQSILQFGAFIITSVVFLFMLKFNVLDNTVFEFSIIHIGICLLYVFLCIFASIILPYRIINNSSPKNILVTKV
ncbi:MAG: hypothetical protein E7258_06260 [Lachnospiraceae bacterium]|nr:hypothetical protein [Lachnospiraceae bacterium]